MLHGRETGRIERSADGEFHEVHEPLDPYTRWTLVQHEGTPPLQLEPAVDENGVENKKGARKNKLRAKLHDFYFGGAVEPVSPAELEAAHHDDDHEQIEAGEHDKVTTR